MTNPAFGPIPIGLPVVTSDSETIGTVKEVTERAFKVDVPGAPDYWLPIAVVQPGTEGMILLTVPQDRLADVRGSSPRAIDDDSRSADVQEFATREFAPGETINIETGAGLPNSGDREQTAVAYAGTERLHPEELRTISEPAVSRITNIEPQSSSVPPAALSPSTDRGEAVEGEHIVIRPTGSGGVVEPEANVPLTATGGGPVAGPTGEMWSALTTGRRQESGEHGPNWELAGRLVNEAAASEASGADTSDTNVPHPREHGGQGPGEGRQENSTSQTVGADRHYDTGSGMTTGPMVTGGPGTVDVPGSVRDAGAHDRAPDRGH